VAGAVERGLRADLRKHGIKTTSSANVATALKIAERLDSDSVDDRNLGTLARELRILRADILSTLGDDTDAVGNLADSAESKL
jgi:hypothetical protein